MRNKLFAFFPFFGAKHNLCRWYPPPERGTLIEPFAGSAGYAHLHWDRKVWLNDLDPIVYGVWDYLIAAQKKDIQKLPLLEPGQSVADLRVHQEAKWLIGFWCYRGATVPHNTLASWSKKWPNRFWGTYIRDVLAEQVECINHWKVTLRPYEELPNRKATWFIDPPYEDGGSHYRKRGIDFGGLKRWVLSRNGQLIVCERAGAEWLPGEHATIEHRTLKRGQNKGRTKETYWHRK